MLVRPSMLASRPGVCLGLAEAMTAELLVPSMNVTGVVWLINLLAASRRDAKRFAQPATTRACVAIARVKVALNAEIRGGSNLQRRRSAFDLLRFDQARLSVLPCAVCLATVSFFGGEFDALHGVASGTLVHFYRRSADI
jgi:hypothetical protein